MYFDQISGMIFGIVYKLRFFTEIDEETLDFFAIFVYHIYTDDAATHIIGRMSRFFDIVRQTHLTLPRNGVYLC